MTFKLLCNQNPRALGIADESCAWDLSKFKEHLKSCKVCGRGQKELKKELKPALEKAFAHGGRRKGAGRKPLGEEKMTLVNVRLSEEHIEKVSRLGAGNISAGVRRAIQNAAGEKRRRGDS